MKKLTSDAISRAISQFENDLESGALDGGYVWGYIEEHTNIRELMKTGENKVMTVALAAFEAGMLFSNECLRLEDDDLEEDAEE